MSRPKCRVGNVDGHTCRLVSQLLALRVDGCGRSIEAVAIVNGELLQGGVTRDGDRNLALPF